MKRPWYVPTAMFAAVLLVAMSLAFSGRSITAQDATPNTGGMEEPEAHPAHIHVGTCDSLGEVVFPLNDVVHESVGTDPAATPQASPSGDPADAVATTVGDAVDTTNDAADAAVDAAFPSSASPTAGGDVVASSTTEGIAATLTDIVAGGHAVNVHLSAEEIGTYIACGEITGEGDEITIQLQELNDSGYTGTATLTDNGDGTTTVVVELTRTDAGMATPTA